MLGPHRVASLDLTGSGIETVAHVRENARITLTFCAFDRPARIVRLFGRGSVVTGDEPGFPELAVTFARSRGLGRSSPSISTASPTRAATGSRGWSSAGNATACSRGPRSKGDGGLAEYRADRDATSIDGLPGL